MHMSSNLESVWELTSLIGHDLAGLHFTGIEITLSSGS